MRVFKHITVFLGAVLLSKAFGFVQSYVLAKALDDPANYGIWSTLLLMVQYSPIVCLGTVETLLKQVPFFLGRNDSRRVHEIENGVMGSIVLSALVAIVLALLAPLVLSATSLQIPPFMVVIVLLTIGVNYFSAYFYQRFAAYEDFKGVGAMDFLRSVMALLFIGGMAWVWGLWGAVLGYLTHEVIMCAVTSASNVKLHGGVGVSFRRELLVGTVKVGLPITLLWWTLTLTGTVDRIVLGSMLGAKAVGYYFFGISIAGTLALVPMVVGRVLYPKVSKHFGQTSDPQTMKRLVLAPTLALGALLVNLQAAILIAMPFVYNVLLPKYRPGLLAGEILLVGSFFNCLLRNGANYLIAANHERIFLKYIVATLIFNVVSDVSLVKLGMGIEGVAVGTSLAGMFLTTLVWRRVLKGLGLDRRAAWSALLGVYLPMLLLLGGVGGMRLVYPRALETFNGASVMAGVALLACVNGLLCCFSLYRCQMVEWKRELWKIRAAFINRNRLAAADVGTVP